MQIGIDLGASKIEYVLLDDSGNEHHRERIEVPKDYKKTLTVIKKIVIDLEKKAGKSQGKNGETLENPYQAAVEQQRSWS